MTEQKLPIFTPEEVVRLNGYQSSGHFHPFTCGSGERCDASHGGDVGNGGILVATVRGWICPWCNYTQDWAHGFMKEWSAMDETHWTAGRTAAVEEAVKPIIEELISEETK